MAESPPILRPIPRRPYNLNPTPTFEHLSSPPSPSPSDPESQYFHTTHDERLETASYFRTNSSANLTSSTLCGIYGNEPETPSSLSSRRQSPISNLSNAPLGFERGGIPRLVSTNGRENPLVRSIILGRRRSSNHILTLNNNRASSIGLWQITWRIGLLFLIGVCYGLIIFHLRNEGADKFRSSATGNSIVRNRGVKKENYNWMYLLFWGCAGVGLGSLLPWIDGLWEERDLEESMRIRRKGEEVQNTRSLAADWNPVVRSIGVFVGIAFAIRKLSWTSTLQVSLTLTLINPVLWYLVDRSLPGFILSSIIGTFGTFLLLTLNPSMMPPPLSLSTSHNRPFYENAGAGIGNSSTWNLRNIMAPHGILDAQMLEISIWVGSILFCSAVCFGGIGRRLAIRRTAGN